MSLISRSESQHADPSSHQVQLQKIHQSEESRANESSQWQYLNESLTFCGNVINNPTLLTNRSMRTD